MSETFRAYALATASEGAVSDEFPVLYAGSFEHSGRKFDVTGEDLDLAVANFDAQLAAGTEIPVDYEHGQAENGVASGWFKALRRVGDKLMARVQWTDKAAQMIKSGERKYVSPEFVPAGKDEHGARVGFKLLAAGLVVRPHLKGLGPVALTEEARAELAEDFTPDEIESIVRLAEMLTTAPTPTPKDAPMAETTVTPKQVEDLTTALSEVRETVETLKTENVALSERADTAEAKFAEAEKLLSEERLSAVLSQARREGRIDAKDETTAEFAELHEKIGLDGVKVILAKIPAETIPLSETGHGGDKPLELSDAPEGVDPQSYKAAKLAEQYESEGMSADEAASKAYKEVYV